MGEDLPHGEGEEGMSYQQLSDPEEYSEQDLSQGEDSSSQDPSDWDECNEQMLCGGDVFSCAEHSDWEESDGQNVSRENGRTPSGHSNWENDSDPGLLQENWPEQGISTKPLCPEDDEWDDDVSLLELPPELDKDPKREVSRGADGLPVPVPREAWVECHSRKSKTDEEADEEDEDNEEEDENSEDKEEEDSKEGAQIDIDSSTKKTTGRSGCRNPGGSIEGKAVAADNNCDKDKADSSSRSHSLLPSWLEAPSGQWSGAVGSSVLPLSQAEEEERPFAGMDRELSEWEDTQETSQSEVPGVPEMSQWTPRSSQELYQGQSPTEAEPAAAAPSGAAEEAAAGSVLGVQEKTDDSDEEMKSWQFLDDLEPFLVGDPELSPDSCHCEHCMGEDLPHGEGEEGMSYQQLSDPEEYSEQDLSQGEDSSSQDPSDWDECNEQMLCGGDVFSCAEHSDWEESDGQNVSGENGRTPSGHSNWENDSDPGLLQENWPEQGISTKPLCPEDDEWDDDVSLLELPPEPDKDPKREVSLGADGLPVPVPREAWVECPAQEPCSQGPAPAPHSPPSPWPARLGAQALHGQPAAPRKRPSRFRRALRALRGLFHCPCLRPQPEE
ncbi:histone-lysine N-methyltransferase SETD1B-like [Anomalospiza imberbis]|uniref:histone-lysine N-methyltransferase SETD1B-like n=1 Tax=Anomalospiza imberbis TaxID=187417 RepID=UPI00358EB950